MHRSWTGILIFDIGFVFDHKVGVYVTNVVVNRETREYSNTDDAEDLKLLEHIIRYHLLGPLKEPEVDGFVNAMNLAMQPKYRGSPDAMTALVKEVFDVAIRAIPNEATEEDFVAAVGKAVSAFTDDDDAGYTRMPGWHSADQVGSYVKSRSTWSAALRVRSWTRSPTMACTPCLVSWKYCTTSCRTLQPTGMSMRWFVNSTRSTSS